MTQTHGTVKWFDTDQDFGFIAPEDGGPDLLVESTDVLPRGGNTSLWDGQAVEFEITIGSKGPQARQVRIELGCVATIPERDVWQHGPRAGVRPEGRE